MAAAATMALRGTFRRALISAGLESFHILGRAGIAARKRGRGIIFTLHHVRPFVPSPFAVNAHLEITPGFLDETLATLKNDGYEPIALGDLPTRLAGPDDGRRYFAFTMDDGYRNNRDHALPVFEKHGVPFTVYVAAGFIDRSRSLWWDTAALLVGAGEPLTLDFNGGTEILSTATMREKHHAFGRIADAIRSPAFDDNVAALDRGALARGLDTRALVEASVMDAAELREFARHPLVSLGAHSVTHTSLAHMDADRLRQELVVSGQAVEAITGRWPDSFAYPYGCASAAGPREFEAARAAGYRMAVTTRPGVLTQQELHANPTALKRVSLNGHYQKRRYVRALTTGLAFRDA